MNFMEHQFYQIFQFIIITIIVISIVGSQHIFAWMILNKEKKYQYIGASLTIVSVAITIMLMYEIINTFKH